MAANDQVAKRAADLLASAVSKRPRPENNLNSEPSAPSSTRQDVLSQGAIAPGGVLSGEALPPEATSGGADVREAVRQSFRDWQNAGIAIATSPTSTHAGGAVVGQPCVGVASVAVSVPDRVRPGQRARDFPGSSSDVTDLRREIASLKSVVADVKEIQSSLYETLEDCQLRALSHKLDTVASGPVIGTSIVAETNLVDVSKEPPAWVLAAIRYTNGPADFIWRFVFSNEDKKQWQQRGVPEAQTALVLRVAPLISYFWENTCARLLQWYDQIHSLGARADRWDPSSFSHLSSSFHEGSMAPPASVPLGKSRLSSC